MVGMAPAARLRPPVVSLFTASPAASRAAQELLRDAFSIEPTIISDERGDELDQLLQIPMMSRYWDSVASKCPSTGTILHFLSLSSSTASAADDTKVNQANGHHVSLISIIDSKDSGNHYDASAVQQSRQFLASHIGEGDRIRFTKPFRLILDHTLGRQISASDITGLRGGLPLLQLPTSNEKTYPIQSTPKLQAGLKEIAIPFYDDCVYPNGQSLLSALGSSSLNRPTVGLYQWPGNGVVLRPLPSAQEDRTLPAPSLVFYTENLTETAEKMTALGALIGKIGYNGLGNSGQLMTSHPALLGLDIRMTDRAEYTSAFPEAQEALLASSLDELQNVNVFLQGGKDDITTRSKVDGRDNQGDCWVEFRANLKQPSGFVKRATGKSKAKLKVAKAPDLPFE